MQNKQVDPEVVKDIFNIIKQSNTKEECQDLPEIFSNELTVSALNSMYPDKDVNILHTLAVSDHCSIILPHLIKYIIPFLYQQRDYEGDTPINAAIGAGRLDNAKVLVEAQSIALREKGHTSKEIKQILENTVNIQDNRGQTPLHRATYSHRNEFINFLVSLGANTAIKDHDGNLPLIYAVSGLSSDERKCKSVIALVKNSQELNIRGRDDKTALEVLRETQRITWGIHQEKELIRACDRQNHNSSCIII